MTCKYFLPLSGLFLDSVIWCTEVLNFDEIHLSTFHFVTCAPDVISKNNTAKSKVM